MPQIIVEDLIKRFRISERDPGIWGAIRGSLGGAITRLMRSTG